MNTELAAPESSTKSNPPKKGITDLSSMLLPVEGRLLLLPGVAVAEIVTFVPPEHDGVNMPPWYLGTIHWRNQRVPLVSYEVLTGGSLPFISSHCRIAVMNNTGLSQQLHDLRDHRPILLHALGPGGSGRGHVVGRQA